MSLAINPIQAAGIMLPILIVMDIVALSSYRGAGDRSALKILIPAGIVGIAIGGLTANWVSEAAVRLIVGAVALAFALNYWLVRGEQPAARQSVLKGGFWGAVAGFTSFVSHAGGPPFQMYMLPLKRDPWIFAGTGVLFFAVVNAVKVVPYAWLGQFSAENLWTSAALLPLAPLATLAGVRLVKIVSKTVFYRITYGAVFLVSLKLIWDGVTGVMG